MNINKWIDHNASSLAGKTVAMTGSTGGIGKELCRYLARLGADLVLLDRNAQKAAALKKELNTAFPQIKITTLQVDLSMECSVASVCDALDGMDIDVFLHNAGAYSIPRHTCACGFGNVFVINFASPYYIINRLLPNLKKRGGRVVVVGSIAHNYSKTSKQDPDFATVSAASRVYGNAKRHLMFSLYELAKRVPEVKFAVAHPGITFTNITAHYPKLIFALIKHPMKLVFMPPRTAALSVVAAFFTDCGYHEWIGPRVFDVWGRPRLKKLFTCSSEEGREIYETAEKVLEKYSRVCEKEVVL